MGTFIQIEMARGALYESIVMDQIRSQSDPIMQSAKLEKRQFKNLLRLERCIVVE